MAQMSQAAIPPEPPKLKKTKTQASHQRNVAPTEQQFQPIDELQVIAKLSTQYPLVWRLNKVEEWLALPFVQDKIQLWTQPCAIKVDFTKILPKEMIYEILKHVFWFERDGFSIAKDSIVAVHLVNKRLRNCLHEAIHKYEIYLNSMDCWPSGLVKAPLDHLLLKLAPDLSHHEFMSCLSSLKLNFSTKVSLTYRHDLHFWDMTCAEEIASKLKSLRNLRLVYRAPTEDDPAANLSTLTSLLSNFRYLEDLEILEELADYTPSVHDFLVEELQNHKCLKRLSLWGPGITTKSYTWRKTNMTSITDLSLTMTERSDPHNSFDISETFPNITQLSFFVFDIDTVAECVNKLKHLTKLVLKGPKSRPLIYNTLVACKATQLQSLSVLINESEAKVEPEEFKALFTTLPNITSFVDNFLVDEDLIAALPDHLTKLEIAHGSTDLSHLTNLVSLGFSLPKERVTLQKNGKVFSQRLNHVIVTLSKKSEEWYNNLDSSIEWLFNALLPVTTLKSLKVHWIRHESDATHEQGIFCKTSLADLGRALGIAAALEISEYTLG